MNKILSGTVILLLLGIGAAYYIAQCSPTLLSQFLTSRIGVLVTLHDLAVLPDQLRLSDFKMKNPEGSPLPDAIRSKTISINTAYVSYLRNPIVIDSVTLDEVYLSIVLGSNKKTACNWNQIFHDFDEDASSWYSIERSFLIKTLSVNGLQVEIIMPGQEKPLQVPLIASLTLNNIQSEEGMPIRELSEAISKALMIQIFSLDTVKSAVQTLITAPVNALEFLFSAGSSKKSSNPCREAYPSSSK